MLTAIITKLKTGTVKTVIAKGDPVKNILPPYIVVWEAPRLSNTFSQSAGGFYVAYHGKRGTQDTLNNYMEAEVNTLLNKVILQDNQSPKNSFRLEDTGDLSPLIETNDDDTISKDRLFLLPKLGAV